MITILEITNHKGIEIYVDFQHRVGVQEAEAKRRSQKLVVPGRSLEANQEDDLMSNVMRTKSAK